MKPFVAKYVFSLRGQIPLLGDKSIAHRAVILSSISRGKTRIENFPSNEDCLATISVFRKLGIRIKKNNSVITVFGEGLFGLSSPKGPIFIKESGTTLRLLLGVLAGQGFNVKLTVGKSLSKRPMLRVTKPLRLMRARISGQRKALDEYPPIMIRAAELEPVTYKIPIASAQVKSSILLAGLFAQGKTRVQELLQTRDHTERMLRLFRADIKSAKHIVTIGGIKELVSPKRIYLPGDISSAAFFMVAAAITPGSRIVINKVSLNPSRCGVIKVLRRMNAKIRVKKQANNIKGAEPAGDIIIQSSILKATIIRKEEVPSLIDELPVLMVAASLARGKTVFEGVQELRVKETDRIRSMTENLRNMGASISLVKSGRQESIVIKGVKQLNGRQVRSFGDHRTAMSMVVAGLAARGKTRIDDVSCVNKSFPGFIKVLRSITR